MLGDEIRAIANRLSLLLNGINIEILIRWKDYYISMNNSPEAMLLTTTQITGPQGGLQEYIFLFLF